MHAALANSQESVLQMWPVILGGLGRGKKQSFTIVQEGTPYSEYLHVMNICRCMALSPALLLASLQAVLRHRRSRHCRDVGKNGEAMAVPS